FKSILGVCLGHQAIAEAFGGSLINLSKVYHGISTPCLIRDRSAMLFKDLQPEIEVGRYHSWIVSRDDFPADLEITAEDKNGYIRALQHTTYDVHAVQFHPESVVTPDSETILKNWLKA